MIQDLGAKIAVCLIATAILCFVSWYLYTKIEQKGYDRCYAEVQAKNLDMVIAYANRLTKAEGERDANQKTIDRLASQRVQVHFPVCPNTGSQDSNGTAGVLSKRVEQSFDDLQTRGRVLFQRCEAINADAIKVNEAIH